MSVTTWNRIQPGNLSGTVTAGLQAAIADPMWMLGRQWQVGELTAEDAGTPVAAAVETVSFAIERLVVGESSRTIDGSVVLEALVEPEPHAPPDTRARLAAGRDLVAALRHGGFSRAATKASARFAMQPTEDRAGAALVRALGNAAIDGEAVLDALGTDAAALAADLDSGADRNALAAALEGWAARYRAETGRSAPSTWSAAGDEYQFSIVAPLPQHDIVLDAVDYRGGRLDWPDFRARVEPRSGAARPNPPPTTEVLLPTPLDFAGGPVRRFFELEHAAVSFGAVRGGPPDVATSLLVETTLIYGGDWFVVPVKVPTCALTRVARISVTDTFGKVTELRQRAQSRGWRMYELGEPALSEFLVVLPVLSTSLDGPPIEEVVLGRDETANIVWAIETGVADQLGMRVERREVPAKPSPSETWAYAPLVSPPSNYFPLVREGDELVGATLVPETAGGAPRGVLLRDWPKTRFAVRDVPYEGLRMLRRFQIATTRSGERRLWISHEVHFGLGGVSSGVAADRLIAPVR